MIVSDLRSRRIGMLPLIVFGIVLLAVSLVEFEWRQTAINVVFNLLTLSLLILALYGYSRVRKMRLCEMIGGGDLAFVLTLMPYFEVRAYMLFLIVSSCITLSIWYLARRRHCGDIPLVSGLGACFVVLIFYRMIATLI